MSAIGKIGLFALLILPISICAQNIYVDDSRPDDTGDGLSLGTAKKTISAGITLITASNTLIIAAGSYSESITINKSITIRGANVGIAGNGTRSAETIIDPGTQSDAITITATDVTIDGIQIGTSNVSSNATTGITNTTFNNVTVQNNRIFANTSGISLLNISSGTAIISDNYIEMLDLEDQTNTTNPSFGLVLYSLNGTVNADITDNDIRGASYGIWNYNSSSSTENLLIDGGTISSCTKGIEISNTDGANNFDQSEVDILNVTMNSFVDPDADLTQPDTQAGIYAFSKGNATFATSTDDITLDIENVDISGIGNSGADYSGLYLADFQENQNSGQWDGSDDDDIGITVTITNCNLHDNENRAVYVRGNNASLVVTQSTFSNNGSDPYGTGGNNGFNLVVRAYADIHVSNSYLTNPATQSAFSFDGMSMQDGNCSLTVTDSYLDQNGNGDIASTTGIDLSKNYFNSVDENDINTWVSSNDFNPYLASGTDTDGGTAGFQPSDASYYVSAQGAQTSGNRIDEAISMVDATGSVILNPGTFTETVTLNKSLTLNGANVGVAGNGTRIAESVIDPGSQANTITITATDVTIDGIQIGTSNVSSNALVGVLNTSYNNFVFQNSIVYANSAGLSISGIIDGIISVSNNVIDMIDLEDVSVTGNPSIGVYSNTLIGTVDVTYVSNDIQDASYGMLIYYANNSSDPLLVDGGAYTGCVKGIEIDNYDGGSGYQPSTVDIQNVVMSSFAERDPDVAAPDAQAGIYSYVDAGSDDNTDDIVVSLTEVDISGTTNSQTDYSAIYLGDFADDEFEITYTITNCNIHDNENRGIFVTGADAIANVTQSTISGNGTDPNGTGYGLLTRNGGTINATNNYITNPAATTSTVSALAANAGGFMTVTDCNLNQNGLDLLASGTGLDLSKNYYNSIDESEIDGWVSSNDFNPYIASGTDTDGGTAGFQPDLDELYATLLGAGTTGEARVQEAHDLSNSDGTIYIPGGDYNNVGAISITSDITAVLLGDVKINALSVSGATFNTTTSNLIVDGSTTITNGVMNVISGSFVLTSTAPDIIETATGYITGMITMEPRTVGTGSLDLLGVSIGADNDIGDVTISRATGVDGIVTGASMDQSIACTWDISSTLSPDPGRSLSFSWYSNLDNGVNTTSCELFRDSGSDYVMFDGTFNTSSEPRTVSTTTSSFSSWTVASMGASLPVELVSFEALKVDNYVTLKWQTASEINSDYFDVQKSKDGKSFESIGKVDSHHNSTSLQNYDWNDRSSFLANVIYYRLNMVDYDGTQEYSKIVSVNMAESNFNLFPNPTSDMLYLNINSEIEHIEVFNGVGQKMNMDIDKDEIDVTDLPIGIYILKAQIDDQIIMKRFIKN
ncbi:MAG: T9SS type A sorting domain-containing protein [Reichenbachiella sp.]